MKTYNLRLAMTPKEEMLELDSRAEKMKEAYAETHDPYFAIMLKAIARKQEKLSTQLKFIEV